MDEDHYIFVGDYFKVLNQGLHFIDQRLTKLKVKYMTPEERKKHEIIEA